MRTCCHLCFSRVSSPPQAFMTKYGSTNRIHEVLYTSIKNVLDSCDSISILFTKYIMIITIICVIKQNGNCCLKLRALMVFCITTSLKNTYLSILLDRNDLILESIILFIKLMMISIMFKNHHCSLYQ